MNESGSGASDTGMMVRRAEPGDIDALLRFNQGIALETEGLRLDPDVLRAGLVRVLGDSTLGFYTVAEIAGTVAGCVLITFEWSDWRNGMIWWIQSAYVDPTCRKRGVFSALYNQLEREARVNPEVLGFRLYVESENNRAQEVYRRRGMSQTHYVVFERLRGTA